ncbi:hypothetical protein NEFER03_1106 [Nematocida sp. LUAm3]|nr:hypothetical protein NEFER03_1106 [Nematocida sp. LUAm3]KAI5175289.1 hypothetical protein NEFER02_1218 [Nematocida sp. LUAm2]KAI5177754.1 hypothetical protein NEFER01_0978 [Nematocida sp. LUAm1]
METTVNYYFTQADVSLKVEKKTKYRIRLPCRVFLVLMACLFLKCAYCITKKEIANTLLKCDITKHGYSPTISNLCKHIDDTKALCSVNLKEYSFIILTEEKDYTVEEWQELKIVLENIYAIRCNDMYLFSICPENPIPFIIIKMLIERVIVTTTLKIHMLIVDMSLKETHTGLSELVFSMQNEHLDNNWKGLKGLMLDLIYCPNEIFEMVMEKCKTRIFRSIFFEDLPIKKLDLSKTIIDRYFNITLNSLPEIESIAFPNMASINCGDIFLQNTPQLKEVAGVYKFFSSIKNQVATFTIDGNIFKLFRKSFIEERDNTQEKLFETDIMLLLNMPSRYGEVEELFSSPWISAEILYIEALSRTCYISYDVVKKLYASDVVARMGIHVANPNGDYDVEVQTHEDIGTYTQEFLESIASNSSDFENIEMCCPRMKNVKTANAIIFTVPSLCINLDTSNEIQEAITKYQENYDTLCIHMGYTNIMINGSDAPENWSKVLSNLFSYMGYGITAENLFFSNIEEPVGEIAQEGSDEHLVKMHKYKFILKEIHFSNCQIGFIRCMLTNYTHAPGTKVHIDCKNIREEDIWSLCQKIIHYRFAAIILRGASETIEKLKAKGYTPKYEENDKLFLCLNSLQWFVNNPLLTECIFSSNFALSSAYLSTLASKSQNVLSGTKEQEELDNFLICKIAVAEACADLKNFSTAIYHIAQLDILMCNSNAASFTTIEELSAFINILKRIFVNMEALRISNVRFGEEIHKINKLHALVNTEDKHKLKSIFLRDYKIARAKPTALSGESETKTLHYSIGGSYLQYLVKKMLAQKNVSIDSRALPFIFGNNGKGNSTTTLEEWEKDLINGEICAICRCTPENIEIYIIHRCKHWFCRPCITRWYAIVNSCPITCGCVTDFDKPFSILRPKYTTKESATEEDFEFVEIDHLRPTHTE